ncbi:hypothetical protein [Bifidobacterium sp. SO1]|uniref:hypothetical protein n=1 Tax=Bifidobacterium sp. SO1 TaxID=2809029 RepID=UPI001BDC50E7|nr:hypothetical protein [Bifidobacterium sp. SO1]MBT1160923.1 hypothetical protein [Bifidobacterium sp. SO1]
MNISKRTIVMTVIGVVLVGGLLAASTIWSTQRFDPHDAAPENAAAAPATSREDRTGSTVKDGMNANGKNGAVDAAAEPTAVLCDTTAVDAVKAYVSGDNERLDALFSSDAEGLDTRPGSRSSLIRGDWLAGAGSDTASCLVATDDAMWAVGLTAEDDGWKATSIVAYSGTVSMPSGAKR